MTIKYWLKKNTFLHYSTKIDVIYIGKVILKIYKLDICTVWRFSALFSSTRGKIINIFFVQKLKLEKKSSD